MSTLSLNSNGALTRDPTTGALCVCPEGYKVVFPEGHEYILTESGGVYIASDVIEVDVMLSDWPYWLCYPVAGFIVPDTITYTVSITMTILGDNTRSVEVFISASGTNDPYAECTTTEVFAGTLSTFTLSAANDSGIRSMPWMM